MPYINLEMDSSHLEIDSSHLEMNSCHREINSSHLVMCFSRLEMDSSHKNNKMYSRWIFETWRWTMNTLQCTLGS